MLNCFFVFVTSCHSDSNSLIPKFGYWTSLFGQYFSKTCFSKKHYIGGFLVDIKMLPWNRKTWWIIMSNIYYQTKNNNKFYKTVLETPHLRQLPLFTKNCLKIRISWEIKTTSQIETTKKITLNIYIEQQIMHYTHIKFT